MKRRDFIRGVGALTAVGFTAVGTRKEAVATTAQPELPHVHDVVDLTPPVVEDDFRYRGRRVRVLSRTRGGDRGGPVLTLSIDGKEHGDHVFAAVGSGYGSHMLPYQTFRRPRELARWLIDRDGLLFTL